MTGLHGRLKRLLGPLPVAILAGMAVLIPASSAAFAAPDLSTVVLSNSLPGLVAASPGAKNGPVDQANLQYLNLEPTTGATLLQQIGKGEVAGYVRFWSHEPLNGDGVFITALRFQNVATPNELLLEQDAALKSYPGAAPFSIPSVPLSVGYTVLSTTSTGTSIPTHVVLFSKGDILFQIGVLSESGDLTTADAVALAQSQAASASGTSSGGSTSTAYRLGEIFGVVILVLLAIWIISVLIRRGRKKRSHSALPASTSRAKPVSAYPSPPSPATAPGWIPSRTNMNEQFFWNGSEWSGRRQWRGAAAGWVEEVPPVAAR